jgi:hypothetical protein
MEEITIKAKINKKGRKEDYINLPIRIPNYNRYDFTESKIIGAVTNVEEMGNYYELTLTIWKRTIEANIEFLVNGEPSSIYIR